MANILFLSQRIPYPPNKGDKIRSFRVFDDLAKRHRVFLASFIDEAGDEAHRDYLADRTAQSCLVRLDPRQRRLASLPAFLTGAPLSKRYFYSDRIARFTHRVLQEVKPELVFVFSSVMAQYVPDRALRSFRYVIDFVDVDSDKFNQYAETKSGVMAWVYQREAKRLAQFDRAKGAGADACLLVSAQEAALFSKLFPELAKRTHAVPNGVDTAYFSPEVPLPAPETALNGAPLLLFTGRMDYWPNQDAVLWFAKEVLPHLREAQPRAHFAIVGAAPSPEIKALGEQEAITVTGAVADIRPYLAACDVALAPMRVARGVQNKVLEALAMGKPVIVSPQGLEGIDAVPGKHLLLAEGPEAYLAQIEVALGTHKESLSREGRQLMEAAYSWPKALEGFRAVLGVD